MALSRKNYEAVAAVVLSNIEDGWGVAEPLVACVARDLADYFASDNERFDRARFLKACGVDE